MEIGTTVKTKNLTTATINRNNILGVQNSICITDENGKKIVYFNENEINKNLAKVESFDNKIGLMVDGPISYYGTTLTAHQNVSSVFKDYLLTKNFSEVILSTSQADIQTFFTKLKTPKTFGILKIVCHGTQSSTTNEADNTDESASGLSDDVLSDMINEIDPTSLVVIFSDVCYSDGLIDKDRITSNAKYVFFSAARESGPDDTRSALYFYGGGYSTYYFLNHIMNNELYTFDDLLKKITTDTSIYYNDNSTNLHHPVIISSSTKENLTYVPF